MRIMNIAGRMIVHNGFLEATPGRMLFRPPEKPAKKCGSINPSAIRMVICASGLPFRISCRRSGIVIWLSMGRVWSEVMTVTVLQPLARTESSVISCGFASAYLTVSSGPRGGL